MKEPGIIGNFADRDLKLGKEVVGELIGNFVTGVRVSAFPSLSQLEGTSGSALKRLHQGLTVHWADPGSVT